MKVEIWSDIGCPFCYIGKRRFEAALERFAHQQDVEVVYRSFELDPRAPRDVPHDVYDMLAGKYGMSREQAKAMNVNVGEQAKSVGLDFQFDTIILTNTFDAHRLIHFAAEHGKMKEMAERLFRAYFTDSLHVGDRAVLAGLAAEVGLDEQAAASMLAGDGYAEQVAANEREAARLGIRGVPYFVIDRRYAVSGAQPEEVFLGALNKAWSEKQPLTVLSPDAGEAGGEACADGSCAVPPPKQG